MSEKSAALVDLVSSIAGFVTWKHPERIRLFAWFTHTHKGEARFTQADIRACYNALSLENPANISSYLAQMQKTKPASVLKDRNGYYLEKKVRDRLDNLYGQRATAVKVDKMLLGLPSLIPDLAERDFLNESLVCFRSGAFRAAIVMTWNLAYDHLCNLVLNEQLATFNTQLPITYPKHKIKEIKSFDDFLDLKESEMIQVCKSSRLISGNVHKILQEKLTRRNMAAHPSTISITQQQA